jgi:hypothetical protein
MEKRTARKQQASSGKKNKIRNKSGLIKGAIIINPAYAVTQMCQIISASTQRKSFKAAAKGFFPDYMISFKDKPVDVPRGPPPQRRINIYIYIKMHYVDRERALNYGALIDILLLAFGYAIFAGVEGVGIAGFATGNLGYISYFAHLGRKLSHDILGNN